MGIDSNRPTIPPPPPHAILERVANHSLQLAQSFSRLVAAQRASDRAHHANHQTTVRLLTDIAKQNAIIAKYVESMVKDLTPPAGTQLGPGEFEVAARGRGSLQALARFLVSLLWRWKWLAVTGGAALAGWKAGALAWIKSAFANW